MDLGLSGRTAIVCGASSGIGLGIAESLAGEGANVVMFARRRELLEREARADRRPRRRRRRDERRPTSSGSSQTAVDTYGGVDILVNNSGGPPRATASELDAEQVSSAVELLLVSVVRLTGLCLPYLERSPSGRIVNVTSSTVREPIDNLALSNAVRPGVVGWAKSLARELGPKGITVNCDRARQHRHRPHPRGLPGRADRGGPRRIPLRRLGTTREIGDVVAFLCSERASYVSGTVILVDGAPDSRPLVAELEALRRRRGRARPARARHRLRALVAPGGRLPLRARIARSRSPTRSRSRAVARTPRATSTTSTSSYAGSVCSSELLPFTRPEGSTLVSEEVLAPDRRDGRGTRPPERRGHEALGGDRCRRRAACARIRRRRHAARRARHVRRSRRTGGEACLDPDDVIVAVDGVPVRTPAELRARDRPARARRRRRASPSVAAKKPFEVTVRTIASPEDPSRAIVGILVDQDANDRAAVRRRHRSRTGRRPVGRACRSRSRSRGSSGAT